MSEDRDQGSGIRDQGLMVFEYPDAAMAKPQPRTFFMNLEEELAKPAPKAMRNEATGFMAFGDKVLVRLCEESDMTPSGKLYKPEVAIERPSEGVVLAVGPGALDFSGVFVPTTARPGDRVLFGKYAGTTVELCGQKLRMIRECELIGGLR